MALIALIRGGGDLASGVALRLRRAGLRVVITELPNPLVVRRMVSFAQAVFDGSYSVEGETARLVTTLKETLAALKNDNIPLLVDPECRVLGELKNYRELALKIVLVDARMTKRAPELGIDVADLMIGLGPGFVAGENCHAVIETNRGPFLGRVIWRGSPEVDTALPEGFGDLFRDRVLRAPADGIFRPVRRIGDHLVPGDLIAEVNGKPLTAPFTGVLRGLLFPGLQVNEGVKVGDLDPRDDPRLCTMVSDKSLAVGGGVLEAILSSWDLRGLLWNELT
jgi:xanthine dehydrogenase accessory factor